MNCEFKNRDLRCTIKKLSKLSKHKKKIKVAEKRKTYPYSLHGILGPKKFVKPSPNCDSLLSILNTIQNTNNLTYNMGNGNNFRNLSPETVALKLMNKEYPNIFGHASPTFIPEVFIPSQPYVYNELKEEQVDILNNVLF